MVGIGMNTEVTKIPQVTLIAEAVVGRESDFFVRFQSGRPIGSFFTSHS